MFGNSSKLKIIFEISNYSNPFATHYPGRPGPRADKKRTDLAVSPFQMPVSELLHLDDDAAVLGRGVEDVLGVTVGNGLDVGSGSTELVDEEVLHGLDALLGELLVATGGTGLLVGGTGEEELGVSIHNVAGEVLEVGLLTLGELGGTEVEVNGGRGNDLRSTAVKRPFWNR